MANGMQGWADLGALIAGGMGDRGPSDAYMGGLQEGYQARRAQYSADEAREKARIARLRAMAREAIPEALATAEYDERMRPLLAAVLQGNQTMDLGQLDEFKRPGTVAALDLAAAAMGEGNIADYNAQMALAQGREYNPYTIASGGKAVLRKDTGDLTLTDLGETALDAAAALAEQRRAAGAAATTRAEAAAERDRRPPAERKAKAAEAPKPPKAGDVVDGYRFLGGDPSKPESWRKI